MQRAVLFVLALGLTLVAFRFARKSPVSDSSESPAIAGANEASPAPVAATPTPRPTLFSAPRAAIVAAAKSGISEECQKLWNDLRGLDMSQKDLAYPIPSGCSNLAPEIAKFQEEYARQCLQAKSPACEQAVYDYRAAATEALTQNTPLSEISDPKVMTDKMIARLRGSADSGKIAEAAERLLELQPDMPDAARAAAMSRLQDAQAAAGKPDDPRWKKLDDVLDRASRANDDPRPYLETKLFAEGVRHRSPERLREAAEETSRRHPELGVGPYHQAWAEHQSGNTQRAQELLQEALRREPHDVRFRQSLEALRRGETTPFQVNLSFELNPS